MYEEQFLIETEFGPIRVIRKIGEQVKEQEMKLQKLAEVIAKLIVENEKRNII